MFAAKFMFATSSVVTDYDASRWIAAVEAADSQPLEIGVKKAMNQLVVDLKSYSLWSAIQTMTVRCGARTLAGALIDIKTPSSSWTNNNFVSGDYNRTTGLIGNASTKYLYSGIESDAWAQDNRSAWEYVQALTNANDHYFGAGIVSGGSGDFAARRDTATTMRWRALGSVVTQANAHAVGLLGMSRSGASTWTSRGNNTDAAQTTTSAAPDADGLMFYATENGTSITGHSQHRGQAGGAGAALSLADMETCLDTYVTAIAALGL